MIHPQEGLVKFGYKKNLKLKLKKKKPSFYIFGYLLETCIEIQRFFLRILVKFWLLNIFFKKHMILALWVFSIAFWLYIFSHQNRRKRFLLLLHKAHGVMTKIGQAMVGPHVSKYKGKKYQNLICCRLSICRPTVVSEGVSWNKMPACKACYYAPLIIHSAMKGIMTPNLFIPKKY